MLRARPNEKEKLINPLYRTTQQFWLAIVILGVLVAAGIWAYIEQVRLGLGVTGMQRPVYWGIYMTNFIFFIGLSLSGTFISAILRLTGAEWRRPITRIAEVITVLALVIASIQIIIDMGRPDRLMYVILYGRLQSPILWDVFVVNLYLVSSSVYLYLPLIPDAAILRDNVPEDAPRWRHLLYRTMALGWRGNAEQWRRLEKAISIMAIFIIPVAISVHTITSWLLATTVQPGWHSTVFGPYFVVTAIFSGIAGLFIIMTISRWAFNLSDYITVQHYKNLGLLFILMAVIWGYFTYTETLILAAAQQTMEFPVLASKLWGDDALSFWIMLGLIAFGFWVVAIPRITPSFAQKITILQPRVSFATAVASAGLAYLLTDQQIAPTTATTQPSDIVTLRWVLFIFAIVSALIGISLWAKKHPIAAATVAGAAVLIGTWVERWNIVIPTTTHPRLIYYSSYTPSSIEIILTISSVGLFFLGFIVFFRLFPAVSLWEIKEGEVIELAKGKIEIPLPEPSESPERRRRWRFR